MSGTLRGFYNALQHLQRPGAKLVRQHSDNPAQRGFYISPGDRRVSDDTAHAIIESGKVQPLDAGLLPNHPQSWFIRGDPEL